MNNSAVSVYDATSDVISVIKHKGYYRATAALLQQHDKVLSINSEIALQDTNQFQNKLC